MQLNQQDIALLQSLPRPDYLAWLSAAAGESSEVADEIERQVGRSRNAAGKLEVAEFFGISVETVDLWQRKGMPFWPGTAGQANQYDLRLIARWLAEQRTIKVGDDTDAAFREEKTAKARLERLQLEGKLVDAERFEAGLIRTIQNIRKGIESFHHKFGDDAVDMLTRICDQAERSMIESEEN